MKKPRRSFLAATMAAALAAGCSTSPPGAGFTSGDKATFTADEKPGVRDDLPMPTGPDSGDAKFADSAAVVPDAGAPASKETRPGEEAAGRPSTAPTPGPK